MPDFYSGATDRLGCFTEGFSLRRFHVYLRPTSGVANLDDADDDENDDEDAAERSSKSKSFWGGPEISSDAGKRAFKDVMPDAPYDFPKAVEFMKRCLSVGASQNDIVLDFFAGSGTTGQAVYEANAEDSGKRRLVLIQLPEQVRSGGFKTIAEITKERLRRVGKRLRNERETQLGLSLGAVDLGFRVFKLDNSNIRAWDPRRDDIAGTLDEAVDHLKTDRSESDVLSELLLKLGLELTVPIEQKKIAGKTVYNIGVGTLLACLDTKIAAKDVEKLAHGIADWHKELAPAGETVVVFRDSAFADDVAKTNLTAILAQAREDRPMIVRSL